MASDAVKYTPINGGGTTTLIPSDIKSLFSVIKTRKTSTLAYAFVLAFVAFTVILAFGPSPNSSSPWFTNIFSSTTTATNGADSHRSQFSSIFSYFLPNNSSPQEEAFSSDSPLTQSNNISRSSKTIPQSPSSNNAGTVAKNSTSLSPSSNFSDPVAKNKTSGLSSINKSDPIAKNASFGSPISNEANPVASSTTSQSLVTDKVPSGSKNESLSDHAVSPAKNRTVSSDMTKKPSISDNQTNSNQNSSKDRALKLNQTTVAAEKPQSTNVTASLSKKKSNGVADSGVSAKQGIENWMESVKNCDFFDGEWVRDESYPLYKPGSCKLIDEQFNCILNGRPDKDFQKLKWKPKGCSLPRLNGAHMLEMIRGKRLALVGDSLNRNMWESLVCILKGSAKDQSKVFEANGRHHFRGEAEYSFVFKDYNCTVEFYVSPFLVQEWEVDDKDGTKKETLRLDLVGKSSEQYKGADIIVFNTGHWWTHEKTSKGENYYQEGSHVYSELNVLEAFRKALTTWARWVDKNVNPQKSLVFFRGYSASHFSGGQWNSGGACDSEAEPIRNETYLTPYPPKMQVLERVLKGMKMPVTYLNITRLTDYRKDGHPSIYRKQNLPDEERKSPLSYQDCSHWCLPGVPDSWNEILYAELLVKLNQLSQTQRRS